VPPGPCSSNGGPIGVRTKLATRLEPRPLSLHASRLLVAQILQKGHPVPDVLRDPMVTGGEGNLAFAEALRE
jgi:hypothetical protein